MDEYPDVKVMIIHNVICERVLKKSEDCPQNNIQLDSCFTDFELVFSFPGHSVTIQSHVTCLQSINTFYDVALDIFFQMTSEQFLPVDQVPVRSQQNNSLEQSLNASTVFVLLRENVINLTFTKRAYLVGCSDKV